MYELSTNVSFFVFSIASVFFFYRSRNLCEVIERMTEGGPNNRPSLPWGFLFRNPQRCVWSDRSTFLDPTGKASCQVKKRIHSTSVPCTSIMSYTSEIKVVHSILHEVPHVFLEILVHNLSPTTSGHNDHRYSVICFPLILHIYWCGNRHDR